MNNKGFTLIELLATISLLAILMLIAVPNVIGVVNRNKNKTYIEDAKKLVALAEYKVRSGSKPAAGASVCYSMYELGRENFDTTAPNGGTYDFSRSNVTVTRNGSTLEYTVQLIENKDGKYIGIKCDSNVLFEDDATKEISSFQSGQLSECP